MHASIIVCTYNRADSLKNTLNCLSGLHVPDGVEWEIIIVDNNSIDHTRQVVDSFTNHCSRVRYIVEKQQGLSHARNRGVSAAYGNILLFTDDDVCPETDWLKIILEGMEQHQCDACGGYIAPAWEAPPPGWLTERFYGFLAIKTDDDGACRIKNIKDAPFGANMAFRNSVFNDLGLFDTSRGRKGSVLSSGEDWEMFERLLNAGMKLMYLPAARVHHRVEASRITKSYFRRWRYQTSFNIAQSLGVTANRRLLGVPLFIFPQLFRAVSHALTARINQPADEAFYREMIVWHFLGMIRGLNSRWMAEKPTDVRS